jgi:hypothetical protein
MNEDKIVINEVEYVKKQDDVKVLSVLDATNVMAVTVMLTDEEVSSPQVFKTMKFKKSGVIDDCTTKLRSEVIFSPQGTKISLKYVHKAEAIERILSFQKKVSFEVWENVNDEGEFKKEQPVLLVNYPRAYAIAPRVGEEK